MPGIAVQYHRRHSESHLVKSCQRWTQEGNADLPWTVQLNTLLSQMWHHGHKYWCRMKLAPVLVSTVDCTMDLALVVTPSSRFRDSNDKKLFLCLWRWDDYFHRGQEGSVPRSSSLDPSTAPLWSGSPDLPPWIPAQPHCDQDPQTFLPGSQHSSTVIRIPRPSSLDPSTAPLWSGSPDLPPWIPAQPHCGQDPQTFLPGSQHSPTVVRVPRSSSLDPSTAPLW